MHDKPIWFRFLVALTVSLILSSFSAIVGRIVTAILGRPGMKDIVDEDQVVFVFVIIFLGIGYYLIAHAIKDTTPKELDLVKGLSSGYQRLLPTSPLKMALFSNFALAFLFCFSYSSLPKPFFFFVLFGIFVNTAREFFTVHLTSREVVEKTINQALTTFYKYSNHAVVDTPGLHEARLRANIMLHDTKDETLGIIRSKGMASSGDKDLRFHNSKGMARRAFQNNQVVYGKHNKESWGFSPDELAVMPHDLT